MGGTSRWVPPLRWAEKGNQSLVASTSVGEGAMPRPTLLLVVLAVPALALAVAWGLSRSDERAWQAMLAATNPSVSLERRQAFTLEAACARPEVRQQVAAACARVGRLGLMRGASIATGVAGLAWLALLACAGPWARRSRALLLRIFKSGLHLTNAFLILLLTAQAALAVTALYALEAALLGRVHVGILAGIGLAALAGIVTLARASLAIVQTATTTVIGRKVTEEQSPALWRFVRETARRASAVPPHHIVVGLAPSFFVTEARVGTVDGQLKGRTMFLSLPFSRILTLDELRAIVGHELGHYKGRDTLWSQRFYPIYRGTVDGLQGLHASIGQSLGSLILLPAVALLGYFLECFAVAESTISRERELAADRIGAGLVGAPVAAAALVKVHAFAGCWPTVQSGMSEALGQGKAFANTSALFSDLARRQATPAALEGLGERRLQHPTDSHPPLALRLEGLGVPLAGVREAALQVTPAEPAATLVADYERLERELTEVEHYLLARQLGLVPAVGAGAGEATPARPLPFANDAG